MDINDIKDYLQLKKKLKITYNKGLNTKIYDKNGNAWYILIAVKIIQNMKIYNF